jgi:hypothetical protein
MSFAIPPIRGRPIVTRPATRLPGSHQPSPLQALVVLSEVPCDNQHCRAASQLSEPSRQSESGFFPGPYQVPAIPSLRTTCQEGEARGILQSCGKNNRRKIASMLGGAGPAVKCRDEPDLAKDSRGQPDVRLLPDSTGAGICPRPENPADLSSSTKTEQPARSIESKRKRGDPPGPRCLTGGPERIAGRQGLSRPGRRRH